MQNSSYHSNPKEKLKLLPGLILAFLGLTSFLVERVTKGPNFFTEKKVGHSGFSVEVTQDQFGPWMTPYLVASEYDQEMPLLQTNPKHCEEETQK